ncbi:YbaB/EbfC family nucleoid-associated protein [Nonomuraea sp. NEAU-A123]|uniref:YbaB/EbfC family nucleoid-associated protein n=1 Tax=Nonomuraea sp. NEAU-A123 TaxID=2839649 RepID=UPI001BE47E51|nr:YbaB/EbfC family nucleoid-associated protein [Nonomuraea sp. NEAU-A123]
MQEDREYLDHLLPRAEDAIRGLRDAHARLGRITGAGEGAEGLVRAVADGRGRVRELVLAPRSKRLDAEALAREVGEAILTAQQDAERQARAIMDEVDAKLAALPKALDAEFVQERIEQVSREIDVAMSGELG